MLITGQINKNSFNPNFKPIVVDSFFVFFPKFLCEWLSLFLFFGIDEFKSLFVSIIEFFMENFEVFRLFIEFFCCLKDVCLDYFNFVGPEFFCQSQGFGLLIEAFLHRLLKGIILFLVVLWKNLFNLLCEDSVFVEFQLLELLKNLLCLFFHFLLLFQEWCCFWIIH